MSENHDEQPAESEATTDDPAVAESVAPTTPLERLRALLLERWQNFPADLGQALDELLSEALAEADKAEAETMTVMNPVSRPQRLRLAVLVTDAGLDTMYRREWAELSVSNDGHIFLVYRRRRDSPYAIEWSHATTLPETMLSVLPEPMVVAILQSDRTD